MSAYDILIPTSGPGSQVVDCLRSIREHSDDYRVIWLDNGAPSQTRSAALEELDGCNMPHIKLRSPENVDTVKGYNACLALSTAPYVLILNDDVEAVSDWLENMERLFRAPKVHPPGAEIPKVGIAACAVTNGGLLTASVLRAPRDEIVFAPRAVPFYCAMISRECIRKVGYLSEEFHGPGLDDDYCRRATKAGFKIAIDLRTVVKHIHGASSIPLYGRDKPRMHREAAGIIRRKYGD